MANITILDTDSNYTELESNIENSTIANESLCIFPEYNGIRSVLAVLRNPSCYRHSATWTVTLTVVYFIIFIWGLVGNSIVIWVLRQPQMKTVANIFIGNLAVADLLVIVFCLPSTFLSNVFIPWLLGDFLCKFITYVQGVAVFASVYCLVAISVHRSHAINGRLGSLWGHSKSLISSSVAVIWIVAGTIVSPWWVVFHLNVAYHPVDNPLPFCSENWKNEDHGKWYFVIVHLITGYAAPLVLITGYNAVIWKRVSSREIPEHSASTSHISEFHRNTRLQVLKTLVVLTSTFFQCWLPLYTIMTLVKLLGFSESYWIRIAIPMSQLLGSFNSCINPILYAMLNRTFRETLNVEMKKVSSRIFA